MSPICEIFVCFEAASSIPIYLRNIKYLFGALLRVVYEELTWRIFYKLLASRNNLQFINEINFDYEFKTTKNVT